MRFWFARDALQGRALQRLFDHANHLRWREAKVDIEIDPHSALNGLTARLPRTRSDCVISWPLGMIKVSQSRVSITVWRQRIFLTWPWVLLSSSIQSPSLIESSSWSEMPPTTLPSVACRDRPITAVTTAEVATMLVKLTPARCINTPSAHQVRSADHHVVQDVRIVDAQSAQEQVEDGNGQQVDDQEQLQDVRRDL